MLPPFGKSWPKLPSCSDLVSLCAFERASRPGLILHPERIVGKQEVIRFLPVCPSCSHNLKNHARDHRHRVVNPWERAANRRLGTLREREKRWLLGSLMGLCRSGNATLGAAKGSANEPHLFRSIGLILEPILTIGTLGRPHCGFQLFACTKQSASNPVFRHAEYCSGLLRRVFPNVAEDNH